MAAIIIDGVALAEDVRRTLGQTVAAITPRLGRAPGLAVVLVGENPASKVYVRAKSRAAEKCGIAVTDVHLSESVSNQVLQAKLRELNECEGIDGILLQLPLPASLDEFAAICAIDPAKDADGLHPLNQGLLMRGAEAPKPCTPKGSMLLIEKGLQLLGRSSQMSGLHAVVLGRSILVGKPMALLLLEEHCTVTICHSRTANLKAEIGRADILVAAIGKPKFVKSTWIKENAIVIDVGINRLDDGTLAGDVESEGLSERAAAYTPVPGGVGPMTIAILLANTVEIALKKIR